jgi:hypothetical protein
MAPGPADFKKTNRVKTNVVASSYRGPATTPKVLMKGKLAIKATKVAAASAAQAANKTEKTLPLTKPPKNPKPPNPPARGFPGAPNTNSNMVSFSKVKLDFFMRDVVKEAKDEALRETHQYFQGIYGPRQQHSNNNLTTRMSSINHNHMHSHCTWPNRDIFMSPPLTPHHNFSRVTHNRHKDNNDHSSSHAHKS